MTMTLVFSILMLTIGVLTELDGIRRIRAADETLRRATEGTP